MTQGNFFRSGFWRPGIVPRGAAWLPATMVSLGLWAGTALADPAPPDVAADGNGASSRQDAGGDAANVIESLSRRPTLLGDMGGLRSFLNRYGVTLTIQETSEVLGNVSGGMKRGFDYDGLTQMTLQLDTARAFHWNGGTFDVSGLQIHGRNLSAENLGTLQTASGIEADRATRLWELWYQQEFFGDDLMDIRIGQQSLDQEFIGSQNALLYVNTMFGWPMVPSADLPGGGPAYPLSAPGLRLRARPAESLTVLAGIFNGSPASRNGGDSQMQNPSGTRFPLNGGVLAIAELQYAFPAKGSMLYPGESQPLPGTYKLGIWYDSERLDDLEIDTLGRSLASPASNGIPLSHRGDYSLYGVIDQTIWQDETETARSIAFFARAMGTPQSDRNLVDFSLNAGFNLHAPFLHREADTVGLALGYAHVSSRAAALDRDTAAFTAAPFPVRSGETFIELTYQYGVMPWWQVQPDFQYVFNPGGGVSNPNAPGQRIKDEAVIGVRTNILF